MKIVRYQSGNQVQYGALEEETVRGFQGSPFALGWEPDKAVFDGSRVKLSEVKLLTPCQPSKYLGVGLNFKDAAAAIGRPCPTYPITFIKPTGAVIGPEEPIQLKNVEQPDYLYEGELALVVGKTAKNVRQENAMEYILGCTCSNDITDRTQFGKDDLRLKGADTFGPIGPCIDTQVDPNHAVIRSFLNGEKRQEGNTEEMIFSPSYMVAFFSSYMTLYPGDVISLGTPAGLGNIKPGDQIIVEVEGIGRLYNPVIGIG